MMRFIKLASICMALVLTGCASGVKYADMASSINTVKADQGRIYFFRSDSMFGAAIQPSIHLDEAVVGDSKPGGFFYVDTTPGNHKVSTTTEVERQLTFTLDAGETKYVKTSPSFGVFVGHVTPELVSSDDALKELLQLKYIGNLAHPAAPAPTVASAKPVETAPVYVAQQPSAQAVAQPVSQPVTESLKPAVQTYAVTDMPARSVATPASVAVAPRQAVQATSSNEFVLGVSSSTVEKIGRQAGCESKQGAGLVSDAGPIETYQMTCQDGKVFVARCEFRQCTEIQLQ